MLIFIVKDMGKIWRKKEKVIGELKSRGFKRVLADSALVMLSPVIILGCIYTGVASPTEAAVISVFYALFISLFLYKSIQIKDLWGILVEGIRHR